MSSRSGRLMSGTLVGTLVGYFVGTVISRGFNDSYDQLVIFMVCLPLGAAIGLALAFRASRRVDE